MQDELTVVGRIGTDPVRSVAPWGDVQATFRLASTRRRQNRETGQWEDAHTNWYTVRASRRLAEHALASLRTGVLVIVHGRLTIREWETATAKGTAIDLDADSMGPDLSVHVVSVLESASSSSRPEPSQRSAGTGQDGWAAAPLAEPALAGARDEPPF